MRIAAQRAFAAAYRKARTWLDRLVADRAVSVESIAACEGRAERSIRQTLSLAFLDPSWTKLTPGDFVVALKELATRGRRFGGVTATAKP